MKNKFFKPVLAIFVILIFNSSCNEKHIEQCNGFIEYSQLMKDYFLFKDSSYWIYKDSATGTLDSFWVTDYLKQSYWPYKDVGTRNCPCYEIFEYKIKRNLTSKFQKVYFQSYYLNKGKDNEEYYIRFDLKGSNNTYKSEDRFSTKGKDSIWNETPVLGGYINKIPQMEVYNVIYKDIQYLYYPNPNPYDWVRKIYYAKHLGVIKFEDEDGRVWELVRYKVKQ